MPTSSELLALLRAADPDRYFCTLFAPAPARAALAGLYLFNHELARARQVASSGPLALIRLQWWRETIEGEARRHPVAEAIAGVRDQGLLATADLLALIEAREIEADDEIPDLAAFLAYARGTAGRLARLAGRLLGADSEALEDIGAACGIVAVLRARPALLPADGTPVPALIGTARSWLASRPPHALRAAALPGVLAKRDLARLEPAVLDSATLNSGRPDSGRLRRAAPPGPRGLGDRLAVLAASLSP